MAKSPAEQKRVLSKLGVRYSMLLDLPYFDPIRVHIIDPMHNLLLGRAKHMMQVWTKLGILNHTNFATIQERVRCIATPKDIGRLPLKISSSFSGFTADQWRKWTIIFSVVSLKGILPQEHLNCWILFVKVFILLCFRVIYKSSLVSADLYLQQFCKTFQQLYGSEECTPNMQMHLHLKNLLSDYGPVYAFWCFAFERFNRLDPAMKRVGTIMFFLKHSLTLKEKSTTSTSEVEKVHIILFCRMQWQQYHSQPLHFGSSALVCTRQTEVEDACCFLPLKRIANRSAFGDITTDFGNPLGTDTAFVVIPMPFNFSL